MAGHAQPEDGDYGALDWVGLDGSVSPVWVIEAAFMRGSKGEEEEEGKPSTQF